MAFRAFFGVVCAATLCFSAVVVHANDSMAELKTGGLEFVQTDEVTMAEEKLFISPETVKVEYRFHNRADHDVEALVAFPMPDIESGYDNPTPLDPDAGDNFLGFQVTQDGKPIVPNLQQRVLVNDVDLTAELKAAGIPLQPLSKEAGKALDQLSPAKQEHLRSLGLLRIESWDAGKGMERHAVPQWTLRSVYWWKTVYPANSDVTVTHSYKTSVGGTVDITYLGENGAPRGERYQEYKKRYCLENYMDKVAVKSWRQERSGKGPLYYENWISYILMTGNNWAGPIGNFTLTVDKGKPQNLISFCGEGVKKIGPTTFQMKKKDFYPERNLDILLLVPAER